MKHFVGLLTGLFAFFYTRNVIQFAASSITGGGKMIINMSFPKMLLPLSTTFTAMLTYFPTLLVYACFYMTVHRTRHMEHPVGHPDLHHPDALQLRAGPAVRGRDAVLPRHVHAAALCAAHLDVHHAGAVQPELHQVQDGSGPGTGHTALPHWILDFYKWDPFSPIINSWNTVLVGNGPTPFYKGGVDPRPRLSRRLLRPADDRDRWSVPAAPSIALVVGAWYFMSREREFAVRL